MISSNPRRDTLTQNRQQHPDDLLATTETPAMPRDLPSTEPNGLVSSPTREQARRVASEGQSSRDSSSAPPASPTSRKVRLRFAKHGDLRMVSHHDLMRCLERMLRRAELPVAQSQGFNPRPKVVFTLALALGIEGLREVVEIELDQPIPAEEVRSRLARVSPTGLEWFDEEGVPVGRPARAEAAQYRVQLPADRVDAAKKALENFLQATLWPYTRHRPDRDVNLDLRPFVLDAEIEPTGILSYQLKICPNGSARPEELVDALGLRDLLSQGAVIARSDLVLAPDSNRLDPT